MELNRIGMEFRPPPLGRHMVESAQCDEPLETFTAASEEVECRPQVSLPRLIGTATVGVLSLAGGITLPSTAWAVTEPAISATVPEGWNIAGQQPGPTLTPPRAARAPGVQKGDYVKHRVNFSNLISNADFTDSRAATALDLQFFFQEQGSFLADYTEGGRTAAQIVSEASEKHGINPWVVLATLEKENSLVTRGTQPGRATLRASMGYAYDDGGSTAGKHSTFAYQVEKGTALLRSLYDEGQTHSFPTRMRVDYDKRRITVRNAATYALMRYTPHTTDTRLAKIGGGNFLFERHLARFQKDYQRFYQQAD